MDLRVVKTREAIREQFLAMLKKRPFQSITVAEIVSACRINRSTFYRNYEDKYALLAEIVDELMEEFDQVIDGQLLSIGMNDPERMRQCMAPLVCFFRKHRDVLLILNTDDTSSIVFQKMTSSMNRKLLENIEGDYALKGQSKKIARYYIGIVSRNILETMRWWHLECGEATEEEILSVVVRSFTQGVQPSLDALLRENRASSDHGRP